MNFYIVPAMIEKTISFRRLAAKNVIAYEIYAAYKDNNNSSGVRTELIDTIQNPKFPNPVLTEIELEYNEDATWELPEDAYLDKDYQFRIYLNEFILSHICYSYNRHSRKFTLDTVIKKYEVGDKVKLEYYRDVITKKYAFDEDCKISVKPIFKDDSSCGYHNIII